MEQAFTNLVQDFVQGKMSRRQLIHSLLITATAATGVSAAQTSQSSASAGKAYHALNVNHISCEIHDYKKTCAFYQDLFGMKMWTGKLADIEGHARAGDTYFTFRNNSKDPRVPFVSHFAIGIEEYKDEKDVPVIIAELKRRGLPATISIDGNPVTKDPDGFTVEIAGKDHLTAN